MLKDFEVQACDRLAGAIVALAANDYKRAYKLWCKGMGNKREMSELRRFFKSPWFTLLAEANGEEVMRLIEIESMQPPVEKKRRKKKAMTDELKPCPFCGGEAKVSSNYVMIKGVSTKSAWVWCKKCHVRTGYMIRDAHEHYVRAAVESWNARCEK